MLKPNGKWSGAIISGTVILMVLISLLGILLEFIGFEQDKNTQTNAYLYYFPFILVPLFVYVIIVLLLVKREPAVLVGGLVAAFAMAIYNFIILLPKYNVDANIGLGLYVLFGWIFPIGPAFLIGTGIGKLVLNYLKKKS